MVISKFRLFVCVMICVWGLLVCLPNALNDDNIASLPSFLPKSKIKLGLDLKGGSQLVLAADLESAMSGKIAGFSDVIRDNLRHNKLRYRSIITLHNRIKITLNEKSDVAGIKKSLQKRFKSDLVLEFVNNNANQGSEASFGSIIVTLSKEFIQSTKADIVARCIETLKRRVDSTGTTEPNILRQGENEILIQVPGLNDPTSLKAIINKTAKLTFHRVSMDSKTPYLTVPVMDKGYDGEEIGYVNIEKTPFITGEQLTFAREQFQASNNNIGVQKPVVAFSFSADGARKISKITRENKGKQFAIVLDGKAISVPVIQAHIPDGSGVISGKFSIDEAKELALLMRSGALPTDLKIIEEKVIGADLGDDSVKAGKNATILSIVLVAIFMLLVYTKFGLMADLALAFNVVLLLAALTLIGATLTLPGIAGIALTIGMAVDANVLIFERIKEEISAGVSMSDSVSLGFQKAFATIVDSNLTTLIGAVMLFVFGSDAIKGFAITLSLGIIISVFTAVTLTRTLIEIWYNLFRRKMRAV